MHFMAKLDKLFKFEDYFLCQTVGGSPYDCYNDVVCPKHAKNITFVVIRDVKSLKKVKNKVKFLLIFFWLSILLFYDAVQSTGCKYTLVIEIEL